jgi:hypothetical protein
VMKLETIQLHGTVFRGTLRDDLGGHEMSICLDLFIENDNGVLKKKTPYVSPLPLILLLLLCLLTDSERFPTSPNDIYSSVVGLKLDPDSAVLSGYCLGMTVSSIIRSCR